MLGFRVYSLIKEYWDLWAGRDSLQTPPPRRGATFWARAASGGLWGRWEALGSRPRVQNVGFRV